MSRRESSKSGVERLPVASDRLAWTHDSARDLRRKATLSESILWEHLRGRRLSGSRFRRQQPIGPYVVDFYCSVARLVIEVDGPVHDRQREYDEARQADLGGAGYRVLRVTADRVVQDLEGVLIDIVSALESLTPGEPGSLAHDHGVTTEKPD